MVTEQNYVIDTKASVEESDNRNMDHNRCSWNPTKLVSKIFYGLDEQECAIGFQNGQQLSMKEATIGSWWSGFADFAKINYPATGKMKQNEFAQIPTKLVPKLSSGRAEQEYVIHYQNG